MDIQGSVFSETGELVYFKVSEVNDSSVSYMFWASIRY